MGASDFRSGTAGASPSHHGLEHPICWTALVVLLGLRFWVPTEATATGDTLWIAAFTALMAGLLAVVEWGRAWRSRGWSAVSSSSAARSSAATEFRHDDPQSGMRFTGWDWGAMLLIGGHGLAGALVMIYGGDRRSAANLLIEWGAMALLWCLLRRACLSSTLTASLWVCCLSTMITLSGLGVWQAWVEQPAIAREYGPLIDAYRRAPTAELQQRLMAAGIPLVDPGLTLFEKRLRDSREPFALFALANTLGGMLASVLPLLCWGLALSLHAQPILGRTALRGAASPRMPWWGGFGWFGVAALLLLLGCLLLTKSRTALLAAAAGVTVWLCLHSLLTGLRRGRSVSTVQTTSSQAGATAATQSRPESGRGGSASAGRTVAALSALALALALAAVLGAVLWRGWDQQVWTEAPKSLLYRWQYWQATALLIERSWLWGVGLGQFRSHYLQVKLPEASEEIADPHNLWFEGWVQGGLAGVTGLLLWAGLWWWTTLAIIRRGLLHGPEHPTAFILGSETVTRATSGTTAAATVTPTTPVSATTPEAVTTPPRRAPATSGAAPELVFRSLPAWLPWASAATPWLAWASLLALGHGWDDRLLVLGLVQGAVTWGVQRWLATMGGLSAVRTFGPAAESRRTSPSAEIDAATDPESKPSASASAQQAVWCPVALASLVVWGLHLSGAGGLGMPAVQQSIWLACATLAGTVAGKSWGRNRTFVRMSGSPSASSSAEAAETASGRSSTLRSRWQPVLMLQIALSTGVLIAAVVREQQESTVRMLGQQVAQLAAQGRWERALPVAESAAAVDRWNPQSAEAVARVAAEVSQAPNAPQAAWNQVESWLTEAERRAPGQFAPAWLSAELWTARARLTGSATDQTQALQAAQEATRRYPTFSRGWATVSRLAEQTGDETLAASATAKALELDDINRIWGHVDRYLPDESRAELERRRISAAELTTTPAPP
jgi:hypothetical protein